MAGFGWLTQVADKAYDRSRDLRPEKNLQRNREIVARTREEAAAQADAEYQALVAQEAADSNPMPALTAGAPESSQPGDAKTIWDSYTERKAASDAELASRSSAGEDVTEEFTAKAAEFQKEKENLTRIVGGAPIGSKAWMADAEYRSQLSGNPTGASVTGAQSTSTSRGGAGGPVRQVAEKFLMDQLLAGPADTRRDEIYLRNLSKARDQVLPTLWGAEGADGMDQEISAVSNRLGGKNATNLEIARMNNATKLSTSFTAADASMARAGVQKEIQDAKIKLGEEANRLRGMALDQKKIEEFGRMIRSSRDNAMRYYTSLRSYAGSQGGFIRDAATKQLVSTQDALIQAEQQIQSLEQLAGQAQEGMFLTGDSLADAVAALGQMTVDPRYARNEVTTDPGVMKYFGAEGTVTMPGYAPSAPVARPRMTDPVSMPGSSGFALTYTGNGAMPEPMTLNLAPGRPAVPPKPPNAKRDDAPPKQQLDAAAAALKNGGKKPGEMIGNKSYSFWLDASGAVKWKKK